MTEKNERPYKDCEKVKLWSIEANDPGQIYIRLKQMDDGDIVLYACDYKGERINRGNLLIIDNDKGIIFTIEEINEDIPLRTDLAGGLEIYTKAELRGMFNKQSPLDLILPMMASKLDLKDLISGLRKKHDETCTDCKDEPKKEEEPA